MRLCAVQYEWVPLIYRPPTAPSIMMYGREPQSSMRPYSCGHQALIPHPTMFTVNHCANYSVVCAAYACDYNMNAAKVSVLPPCWQGRVTSETVGPYFTCPLLMSRPVITALSPTYYFTLITWGHASNGWLCDRACGGVHISRQGSTTGHPSPTPPHQTSASQAPNILESACRAETVLCQTMWCCKTRFVRDN